MRELQNALDNGTFCKHSKYGSALFTDQNGKKISLNGSVVSVRGSGNSFLNAISYIPTSVKMVDNMLTIDQLEFWDSYIKSGFARITDKGSYFTNSDWFDRKVLDRIIPGNSFFFRTKLLDFALVLDKDLIFDKKGKLRKNTPFYQALKEHNNDFFVMSEVEDSKGINNDRYRAVIKNGEVESIYKAVYGDDEPIECDLNDKLVSFVKEVVENVKDNQDNMPSSYACEFVSVKNGKTEDEYAISTFYHYGEVAHPVSRLLSSEDLEHCLSLIPKGLVTSGANVFNRNAMSNFFSYTYAKKLGFRVGNDYLIDGLDGDLAATNKGKKIGGLW